MPGKKIILANILFNSNLLGLFRRLPLLNKLIVLNYTAWYGGCWLGLKGKWMDEEQKVEIGLMVERAKKKGVAVRQERTFPVSTNNWFVIVVFTIYFQGSVLCRNAFAYLDPGTGTYIFQLVIAGVLGALFTIKVYWRKIKSFFSMLLGKREHKKINDE